MAEDTTDIEETQAATDETDEGGTIIRDTDIVFDCPHCGHNLAIDYRGAGLQIVCVNCGENVLVPIPNGMKIDDLDLETGDILKQLFATRRNLQKAELRAEALAAELAQMTARRDEADALIAALGVRAGEMKNLLLQQAAINAHLCELTDGLAGVADAGDGMAADASGEPAAE